GEKIDTLKSYIDDLYLFTDRYDEEKLEQGIYKGMFESLDDIYSVYYTPSEYQALMESSTGSYSGIGCYVQKEVDTGDIVLVKPMKNSPAEKAGIRRGDVLVTVNGDSVVGMDLDQVVALIKGEEGTDVTLGVVREGSEEVLEIKVTRAHIEVDTIEYEMLENSVGYIKIVEFDTVTEYQFDDAVTDLEAQGMKKLVIDVRDNPGGSLQCVLDILDRLLPEGELLRIVDRDGNEEAYNSDDEEAVKLPMAVLVNGDSASASEVFSGAMKDRGAAVIVGTNTFGKGIVQSIYELDDGSGLRSRRMNSLRLRAIRFTAWASLLTSRSSWTRHSGARQRSRTIRTTSCRRRWRCSGSNGFHREIHRRQATAAFLFRRGIPLFFSFQKD
ncbi:MAG: S41 family peptidase, partial [Lachnospiraceae bacterium]|nr:S41 family peptidase [Lachnospiraceae bacterium]